MLVGTAIAYMLYVTIASQGLKLGLTTKGKDMSIIVTCEVFGRVHVQTYTAQADALKWIAALISNDVPFQVTYKYI